MKLCARNILLMAIAIALGMATRYVDAHPAVILAAGGFVSVLLALLADVD